MRPIAMQIRTRRLIAGVVVESDYVLCRRKYLKQLLKKCPHLASFRQTYIETFNIVILTECPLAKGQLTLDPAYAAKARREDAEWSALLDAPVEVGSAQGRG